jgi:hypothetical protein
MKRKTPEQEENVVDEEVVEEDEEDEEDKNYKSRQVVKKQKKEEDELQEVQGKQEEEEKVPQDDEPELEPVTDPLIYSGIYAPSGFDIMKILVRACHPVYLIRIGYRINGDLSRFCFI